ncbi:MAG: hypothetical protein H7259_11110 [Cytophagales bacterium]|nr:hypothetical protein [Cytophaga sp.]
MSALITIGMRLNTFVIQSVQTVLSTIKVVLLSRPSAKMPVLLNSRCCILGNGPSLTSSIEDHLSFLNESDLVCVNTFAASTYYEQLKPGNYVLLDPLFFSEEGRTRDVISSTFQDILEKTSWPMYLYVPQKARKAAYVQEMLLAKKNIQLVYFNYTIFEGFDVVKHWFFKRGLAMPQAENVLVATLFLMINRAYGKILLFGADHSWHEQIQVREDNVLTLKDLHFYNADVSKEESRPLIRANKEKVTISKQFLSFSKAFRGYDVLKIYAETRNVAIFNASAKSYVDSFERIKIN